MHIYFSGIGGSGLCPLSLIAQDLGLQVSGSEAEANLNTDLLEKRKIPFHFNQDQDGIDFIHRQKPIDWVVYTSSLPDNHPELEYARTHGIQATKRDVFINYVLEKANLQLISIAGTHGKTTTTAMTVWLLKNLNIPCSYLIGSNLGWGDSGKFIPGSKYFVMETDEFDKNFLHFNPHLSLITSLDYDHPDTYPTQNEYHQAFLQFINQSERVVAFLEDLKPCGVDTWNNPQNKVEFLVKKVGNKVADYRQFTLLGLHNRQNAALVNKAMDILQLNKSYNQINNQNLEPKEFSQLTTDILNSFPGTQRRMEKLGRNLYSDYAHHPTEIMATLNLAKELIAKENLQNQTSSKLICIYQPHQNIRQHQVINEYQNCFDLADKIYWLPTYLTRENPELEVLTPAQLVEKLTNPQKVEIAEMNTQLVDNIIANLQQKNLVLLLGAGSIDTWIREGLGK